jgi:hypothetical protein
MCEIFVASNGIRNRDRENRVICFKCYTQICWDGETWEASIAALAVMKVKTISVYETGGKRPSRWGDNVKIDLR